MRLLTRFIASLGLIVALLSLFFSPMAGDFQSISIVIASLMSVALFCALAMVICDGVDQLQEIKVHLAAAAAGSAAQSDGGGDWPGGRWRALTGYDVRVVGPSEGPHLGRAIKFQSDPTSGWVLYLQTKDRAFWIRRDEIEDIQRVTRDELQAGAYENAAPPAPPPPPPPAWGVGTGA